MCPPRKKKSLEEGTEDDGGDLKIITFPIKTKAKFVLVWLPAPEEIDTILGTKGSRATASDCIDITGDAFEIPMKKFIFASN